MMVLASEYSTDYNLQWPKPDISCDTKVLVLLFSLI